MPEKETKKDVDWGKGDKTNREKKGGMGGLVDYYYNADDKGKVNPTIKSLMDALDAESSKPAAPKTAKPAEKKSTGRQAKPRGG